MTGKLFGARNFRQGEHDAFAWDRVVAIGFTVAFWLALAVVFRLTVLG